MLKNFVRATYKTEISYTLDFDDGYGNGFSFPCDAEGNVIDGLQEAAYKNLEYCKAHPEKFVRFGFVEEHEYRHRNDAHGTCTCGNEVYLYDEYYGACRCEKCGRWYNMFGQELLDPKYWETDPAEEEYYGCEN